MKALAGLIVEDIKKVRDELGRIPSLPEYLHNGGLYSEHAIKMNLGGWILALKAAGSKKRDPVEEPREPRVLIFDIETKPLEVFSWGIWEQNIAINQIKSDWCVFSYAAKWLGKSEMFYADQSKSRNITDDKKMLRGIWELLHEADVVITQNGKAFDVKKLNTRFIINGMGEPASFEHIDTKQLAKKKFSFTSNSLEYLCKALKTEHQKLKHGEFPGMELWIECIKRNPKAWAEMRRYNENDVHCLEDVYHKLRPWGSGVSFNPYRGIAAYECDCGNSQLTKRGFQITKTGKFQKWQCQNCGAWHQASGAKNNLFSDKKKASLKRPGA